MKGLFKDLSFAQLAAGALAAATSFLLSSKIGITGSLIGVVVGSVVSAISTQVYKKAISSSTDALKQSLGVEGEDEDGASSATKGAAATGTGAPGVEEGERDARSMRAYGPATAGLGGSASPRGNATGTVYGSRYNTAYAPAEDGTDAWGTRPIGAHSTRNLDAATSAYATRSAYARADEDDFARATEAIASLDNDPTLLVGEGGSALYPSPADGAAWARNTAAAAPAQVDRTMRMPNGTAYASTAGAYASRSAQTTTTRGAAASATRTSPYGGSVAAHEAQARKIARRNRLIGVVTVLSALVAVAVVAVLVNVVTSGEGIGYRPTPIISNPASLQEPVAPEASQTSDAATGIDAAPSAADQGGTTTTAGTDAMSGTDAGTTTTGTGAGTNADATGTENAAQGGQDTGTGAGGTGENADAGNAGDANGAGGETDAGTTVTPGTGENADAGDADDAGTPEGTDTNAAGNGTDAGGTEPAATDGQA